MARAHPKSQKFAALTTKEKERRISRLPPAQEAAARKFWGLGPAPRPLTAAETFSPITAPGLPISAGREVTAVRSGRIEHALGLPPAQRARKFGFATPPPTQRQTATLSAFNKALAGYQQGRVDRKTVVNLLNQTTRAWAQPAMPTAVQLGSIEKRAKAQAAAERERLAAADRVRKQVEAERGGWWGQKLANLLTPDFRPSARGGASGAGTQLQGIPGIAEDVMAGAGRVGGALPQLPGAVLEGIRALAPSMNMRINAGGAIATDQGALLPAAQRAAAFGQALGPVAGLAGKDILHAIAVLSASSGTATVGGPIGGARVVGTPEQQAQAREIVTGAGKALGAGVTGVGGLVVHPGAALGEAVQMGQGQTQMVGLLASATDPRIPLKTRQDNLKTLWTGTVQDLKDRYGADVTFKEALAKGYNEPLISILNAAALVYPAARGASMLRFMNAGATLREALRLSRDPALAKEILGKDVGRSIRKLTVRPKYGDPYQVEVNWSRAASTRAVQRGLDVAREGLSRAGARGVPGAARVGESKALRTQRTQIRRAGHRLRAEGAALWRDVAEAVGRNPDDATRLFWDVQRPLDVDPVEWLRAIQSDIEQMLDGREPVIDPTSPEEKKLQREINRFRKAADNAWRTGYLRRVERVHETNARAAVQIENIDSEIADLRQQKRDLKGDDSLTAAEREQAVADLDSQIDDAKKLRDTVAKEQLLPGEQAVTDSPTRQLLVDHIDKLPNVDPEQGQGIMAALDSAARTWALRHDRDASDFWDDPTGLGLKGIEDIGRVVDVTQGVLAQRRVERTAYNAHHKGLINKLVAAEGDWEDVKAAYPEKDARGNVIKENKKPREDAQAALAKAREDELYARIKYRSNAWKAGKNFATNPDRGSLASRLYNRYKGQKNALPPKVRSAKELEWLVSLMDELMTEGEAGRFWYENSAEAMLDLAGGDKEIAARIAQLVAIYSPQKAVIPNLGEAIKAYNTFKVGREITNGQKWQIDAATDVLSGKGDWDGRKTNNFYLNFLEEIDKPRYEKERILTAAEQKKAAREGKIAEHADRIGEVTADMWMARVFGYLRKEVSDGRYDVIEQIVQQLAKEHGWKPKQVQAAIWTTIKNVSDDVSANVDFRDAVALHTGHINYEAAPGEAIGAFGDIYRAWDTDTQIAYTTEYTRLVDDFLQEAGLLHYPSELGPGIYGGTASPGARATFVSAGRKQPATEEERAFTGTYAYRVSDAERALLNFVSASIGKAGLQDSVAWVRPFKHVSVGHGDTVMISLGRRATDEEALALWHRLNPGGVDNERVFVIHAGNEGLLLRRAPYISQEDFPNLAQGKAKRPLSFQGQVDDAIADILPGERGGTLASDGELVANDWTRGTHDYDQFQSVLGDGRGSEEVLRLQGAADRLAGEAEDLRRRFTDDANGETQRHGARNAVARRRVAQRGGPELPRPPPRVLAQTRQADLLGAVQFLDTPEGGRILYLSQQADAATLLHELIGHGVREMKASYPEEFGRVEEMFGRQLEDWTVDDHERFATMAERYFADGRAPTPELVPVFRRMKTWIRSIYGAIRELGRPVSPEVAFLLDTYFGAYNDANVFRVAQLGVNPKDRTPTSRATHLAEHHAEELATLRRRKDAAAYRKSLEGVGDRITALVNKAGEGGLTAAEEETLAGLEAHWLNLRAAAEVATDDRQRNLGARYDEIERALTSPKSEAYDRALESLHQLVDMREQVLRSVFGSQYDAVFANRVDLVADFLVEHGLLKPDFARGTARYTTHQPLGGLNARRIDTPAVALETQVVGRVNQSLLNLHRRNQLLRFQSGDLHVDPKVIFEAWQNAQAFAFIHELKNNLWDLGRELRIDEAVPEDAYILNMDGIPVPNLQRRTMSPASSNDVQDALDALDGRDLEKTEQMLIKYAGDVFITPERYAEMRANGFDPLSTKLRVIDKRIVDALFRPLRGGASRAGTGWDLSTTIARWSLIYSNPAYIPVNFIGNGLFLLAQQGPRAVSSFIQALHVVKKHPDLAIHIATDTGELPAQAAISGGRGIQRGWYGRMRRREENVLRHYTAVPDKWPRMAAWIYEAQRMGYRNVEDWRRLVAGKTETTRRARDTVSERATEVMVNFDRLSDFEKQIVTRVLFIWPWIRGATAWPFYYAREFPVRTAALANVGITADERRTEMLGNVAGYRRNLVPISTKGGKALVANYGPISPTSTAAESLATVQAIFGSLLGHNKLDMGQRLVDYVNPSIQGIIEASTGKTSFGKDTTLRDILIDNAISFIPFGMVGRQILDPSTVSKVYDDRSWKSVLKRKLIRVDPETVDIARINAFQKSAGKKTTEQKAKETTDALVKQVSELGGTEDMVPASVRRAITMQQVYRDWKGDFQKTLTRQRDYQPKAGKTTPGLTPHQNAALAYAMVERYAPAMAEQLLPPDQIPEEALDTYADAILYGNKTEGIDGLFQPLVDFRSEISKEKRAAKAGS